MAEQSKLSNGHWKIAILISGICKSYFIWKKGVFVDVTKLRLLRWRDFPKLSSGSKNTITKVLIALQDRGRRRLYADTPKRRAKEEVMWAWRQRLEWCQHNPRKCLEPPEGRRDNEGYSPGGFGENIVLQTSWFQTCCLQNCEGI